MSKLSQIQHICTTLGYAHQFYPKSQQIAVDLLLISFQNQAGKDRTISVMISPIQLHFTEIIVFYYALPTPANNISGDLLKLLFHINTKIPLGHFAIYGQEIQFRYNYATATGIALHEQATAELLGMIAGQALVYAETIESFIKQEINLQQAYKQVAV